MEQKNLLFGVYRRCALQRDGNVKQEVVNQTCLHYSNSIRFSPVP